MTETSDPQLQLKKRARRRLVGAVAFAGLAAVVLPMVMDEEPRPSSVPAVAIRIPGQDEVAFKPDELAARATRSPTAEAAAPGGEAGTADEVLPAGTPSTAAAAGVQPTEKVAERPAEKPAVKKVATPPENAEKPAVKKVATPPEKISDKAADRKVVKPTEKTSEKAPEKTVEKKVVKPAEKVPEKPVDKKVAKPVEKVSDKPPVKKVDKPSETTSEEAGKPPGDDGHGPRSPEAAPTKSGGQQVILIGAFANPENAKQLQGKMSGAGISNYTEILDTPDGRKTRVRAGPFPSREAAERALEKLRKIGVSGVVAGRQ
ncbi:MAG: SPOR domain-containing protein [Candidatus Accumulibacter sp. UW27]|jgi:DedD protein